MDEGLVYLDWPLLNRLYVAARQDNLTVFVDAIDLLESEPRKRRVSGWKRAARDAFYRVIKDWGISGSADMAVHLKTLPAGRHGGFGAKTT